MRYCWSFSKYAHVSSLSIEQKKLWTFCQSSSLCILRVFIFIHHQNIPISKARKDYPAAFVQKKCSCQNARLYLKTGRHDQSIIISSLARKTYHFPHSFGSFLLVSNFHGVAHTDPKALLGENVADLLGCGLVNVLQRNWIILVLEVKDHYKLICQISKRFLLGIFAFSNRYLRIYKSQLIINNIISEKISPGDNFHAVSTLSEHTKLSQIAVWLMNFSAFLAFEHNSDDDLCQ